MDIRHKKSLSQFFLREPQECHENNWLKLMRDCHFFLYVLNKSNTTATNYFTIFLQTIDVASFLLVFI